MLSTKIRKLVNNCTKFVQFNIFPPSCVLCDSSGHTGLDLCPACQASFATIESPCPSCGMPLQASEHSLCGRCLSDPPPYQKTISPFYYEPPLIKLVTDFKFNHKLKMARVLAGMLQPKLHTQAMPEVIIPVPLHQHRLKERGYNQSLEMARLLGSALTIPVDYRLCKRTRHTPPQTGLKAKERKRNIKNAFGMTGPCDYRHVAILDDVITTGHTVAELAKLLRKHGVEEIQIWSVARAVPD